MNFSSLMAWKSFRSTWGLLVYGSSSIRTGIRTPVTAVKGRFRSQPRPQNGSRLNRAGHSAVDHERSDGAARCIALLDAFHAAQVDLHLLPRNVDARVATKAALGEEDMRIVRNH